MRQPSLFPRPSAGAGLLLAVFLFACGSAEGDNGDATARGSAGATAGESPARAAPTEGPRPSRGTAWVIFGTDTVVAEVARTADERSRGLMYRDDVPDGTGMLFVFEESGIQSFWMQNTYVALDIAYMDASFRVVDIQQMEPETEDQHESAAPAMFALEVRQGWFAEHGVEVGDTAEIVFGG